MTTAATSEFADLVRSWKSSQDGVADVANRSTSAKLDLPPHYSAPGGEGPGLYPFTRGRSPRGYLDQLWVMGQYSGFASPRETQLRFKTLLEAGQTGLSIALDLPTQMGLDSDDPRCDGEVGRVGTPIDSVDDLIAILDGLPLDRVRQMRTTANAIGPIFSALVIVALRELGSDASQVRLMLQNDPLKEFIARGTYIFPPAASVELAVDVVEYCGRHLPHWDPIEFCGYHIRDAGGTVIHEAAVATANGIAYLDAARRRSVDYEWLAESLFIFASTAMDIFEEAAKLRALRRIWARLLHERYGVSQERARINLFVYTLGGALVAQEPLNNLIRVTCETLAAVLGGADTLATSSFDEAVGLPSSDAAHLALRTQQIIAHESGVTKVVDPLAGSLYLEDLTDRLTNDILEYIAGVVDQGGAIAVIENGVLQAELGLAAYEYQREIESGERPIVGVNIYPAPAEQLHESFRVPQDVYDQQIARLTEMKARRDQHQVVRALDGVRDAAARGENSIPALIEASEVRATLGEMVSALAEVYGRHTVRSQKLL